MWIQSSIASISALALAALLVTRPPHLPKDTLPPTFGTTIPYGLTPSSFVEPPARPAEAKLGRALFFDPILSLDRSVSCATCHDPEHGFADALPLSLGIRGQRTVRNSPSLFNRGFGTHFSWTGLANTLEEQMLRPIQDPLEMGLSLTEMVERLKSEPRYATIFRSTYGEDATAPHVANALAAFVSRIHFGDSPVDRFQAGDFTQLDDHERAGLWIYESKGGCWRCHVGSNFTDEEFHNTGVSAKDGVPEEGRLAVTREASDRGRFKTPTLRALALTAPYMHDGSLATLEDVVAFYARGGGANAHLDERIRPIDLAPEETLALVAFLKALSRTTSAK